MKTLRPIKSLSCWLALICFLLLLSAAWADENPFQPDSAPSRSSELVRHWLRQIGRINPPSIYERSHGSVVSAFDEVVSPAAKGTVRVLRDERHVAMGAVIDRQGYILTKASEILTRDQQPRGEITVKLADEQTLPAQIIGIESQHDLAMLKVDATNLPEISWGDANTPLVGSFLATPNGKGGVAAIGVASAAAREIEMSRGVLGIEIADDEAGPKVAAVIARSAAARARLAVGDVVLEVNGLKVGTPDELSQAIGKHHPGDLVRLSILREGQPMEITATLGRFFPNNPNARRRMFQETLGTALSERREGFPVVFQHDTALEPRQCGGPLVDLDGKVVGINIARSGRVSTYAIPAQAIIPLLSDLKSGRLAPATGAEIVSNERKDMATSVGP